MGIHELLNLITAVSVYTMVVFLIVGMVLYIWNEEGEQK